MGSLITNLELQQARKAIGELRLLDDDLMTMVFDRNIEATEFLLKLVLERDDLTVTEVVAQKELRSPMSDGRNVVFDISAIDREGKVYNIEVQRAKKGVSPKRARFHSSVIDSRMLKANQQFQEIRDSYVIFITEEDVLGDGSSLYHIERVIRESSREFGDGSHILYVNGSYENEEDAVGRLMHDFRCKDPDKMFYPILAEGMRHFKETEGGTEEMSSEFRQLAEKVGARIAVEMAQEMAQKMAQEKAQKMLKEAEQKRMMRMLDSGKYSTQEVADVFELTLEQMECLQRLM